MEIDSKEILIKSVRFSQLLEAIKKIHSSIELEDVLNQFLKVSVMETESEGGTIYLINKEKNTLESIAIIGPPNLKKIELKIGEGIAGKTAITGQPIVVMDTEKEGAFTNKIDKDTGKKTKNTACFPLKDEKENIIGVLQLVNKKSNEFQEEELQFLKDLSIFLSLSIRNAKFFKDSLEKARMERELALAAEIQKKILPSSPQKIEGFEIKNYYKPCYEMAGDYYNFFKSNDNNFICIFDVSGKGIDASMVANTIHTFLSLILQEETNLELVFSKLNSYILNLYELEKYATGIILKISKNNDISFINAGHTKIIHINDFKINHYAPTSPPIGMIEGIKYEEKKIEMKENDLLILYSDGYIEAKNKNDEELGLKPFSDLFYDFKNQVLEKIIEKVNEKVSNYEFKQTDDKTLICIKKL